MFSAAVVQAADRDAKLQAWIAARGEKKLPPGVLTRSVQAYDRLLAAYQYAREWAERSGRNIPVEKNNVSRFHELEAAFLSGRIYLSSEHLETGRKVMEPSLPRAIFLIEHDWSRLLKNADGTEGNVVLPAPYCAFEIKFSGMHIVACVDESDNMIPHIFHHTPYGWTFSPNKINGEPYWKDVADIVRATCIMLDSNVAEVETIRVSIPLNSERQKRGKRPLCDYHIVRLDRRRCHANAAGGGEKRSHPRLHFRRGHWRHFDAYKTWIRWMLVGDPDLGFVDKEYRT